MWLIKCFNLKIGILSNDDGDGNKNGKKPIGLDWQNNNAFCTGLSRCCMNTMQKVPNFTFCRGQKHN